MTNLIASPLPPNENAMGATEFLIEADQPFAQSFLWEMQKNYFEIAGPDAWRLGVVPHYITSNPHIARSYAELIFAFFRDQHRLGKGAQKVRILELGAGSGKLAYSLLRSLDQLCHEAPFPIPDYQYLLTDLPRSNVDFWKEHPRFSSYFAEGRLDVAVMDALDPEQAILEFSQERVAPLLGEGPLIIVANYFFDSIPQDLFRVQGSSLQACHSTLRSTAHPDYAFPAEILFGLKASYTYHDVGSGVYGNPEIDGILEGYSDLLENSHLLYPHTGMMLLQSLLAHAPHGAMLLSADKGEHRIEELKGRGAPVITKHGSFSLQVNYHALREMCRLRGGLPLAPTQMNFDIEMHCMLFHKQPEQLLEVKHAYRHHTDAFSPDNFFGVKKSLEKAIPEMNFREIIAALQVSRNDPRLFTQLLPKLFQMAPKLAGDQALTLLQTSIRVWDNHFPLGENVNLAKSIGELLKLIGFDQEAKQFLEISGQLQQGAPEA